MSDRDPVEVLAEEFTDRFRRGERPSLDDYTQRYPEYAEQLRRVFPTLMLMENVADEDDLLDATAYGAGLAGEAPHGMVLGDFRILREVARGGMGVVYEAEQISLGRHVALKVLPGHVWLNPRHKKRFQREVRAAAQLHHTNIVPVFGVGEQDGIHYYAMQFIRGPSLAEVLDELRRIRGGDDVPGDQFTEPTRSFVATVPVGSESPGPSASPRPCDETADLKRHAEVLASAVGAKEDGSKPDSSDSDKSTHATPDDTETNRLADTCTFPVRSVLDAAMGLRPSATSYWYSVARVGIQVANALQHAHSQGIAHRDIKPSNLLFDVRGTVWVTDFGLAKSNDQDDVTNTGDIIGTLRYMAPENFEGQSDARSDLYSLGLTLYELLALRPAFDETDRSRLMRQVTESTPPSLHTIDSSIPRDLETIVSKAIEREPSRRFQSGQELADDLQRFIDDEPIHARRVGLPERLWRCCRRNPAISWTTAVASVLIITTVATAFVLIDKERDEALRLAGEMQYQAEKMAVLASEKSQLADEKSQLAEEKAQLADQERLARFKEQMAKDQVQAALRREEESRRSEQELRVIAESARDRADEAAKEAQTVTNFLLLEMYGAASPGRSRGDELTVRSLLDWSAQRVDTLFGTQPLQKAAVRDALGQAYQRLGLYDKAHRQLEVALEIRQRLLGPEHITTLTTTNVFARVLYHEGKYTEAYDLCAEALPRLEATVGTEHAATLSTMNTLAMCSHGLGRPAEAQKLADRALGIQRRILGEEHRDTLATMNTLAMALHSQKDYAGAHRVLSDSLDILRKLYGPDHPNTLSAMANLAASIYGQGDYSGAEEAYAECWDIMKRVMGPDHPTTVAIQENLAVTMMFQKKYAEAEPLLRDAVTRRTQTQGDVLWRAANTTSQLAACLTQLGQYKESESLLLESYQTLSTNQDTPPEFVRMTLQRLVILYRIWKKTDKMTEWRAKLIEFSSKPGEKTRSPVITELNSNDETT